MKQVKQKLLVIVGPTASGKSDLAIHCAKKWNSEIISADSRQVYKGMSIGTGKVTKKEMQGIRHYLLDVAHPARQFTVVQYKKQAEAALQKIYKHGVAPILVGGTGFYIQAVLDDVLFPRVPPNKRLRKKLERLTATELFGMLKRKDPQRAKTIEQKNKRRLIRALEIIEKTGKPIPTNIKSKKQEARWNILLLGIWMPNKILDKRIKTRLHARLNPPTGENMIAEVKHLRARYRISWQRLENFGLEYRWIARYLQKQISHQEMEEKLYQDIKRYARRQMTWFKRDPRIIWIEYKNKTQLQKEADSLIKNWLQK